MAIINKRIWSAGGMILLERQILGAPAASVTFLNISQLYSHLIVIGQVRSDDAALGQWCNMRLNADAAANYDELTGWYHPVNAATCNLTAATNQIPVCRVPGAGSAANWYQQFMSQIPNYRDNSFHRTVVHDFGSDIANLVAGNTTLGGRGGRWSNTAAVTQIDIIMAVGNFLANSRFELWAMKD